MTTVRRSTLLAITACLTLPSLAHAGIEVGACSVNGLCHDNNGQGIDRGSCEKIPGGEFLGDGTACASVPAASSWALVCFTILLAACGTIVLRRRSATICFVVAIFLATASADSARARPPAKTSKPPPVRRSADSLLVTREAVWNAGKVDGCKQTITTARQSSRPLRDSSLQNSIQASHALSRGACQQDAAIKVLALDMVWGQSGNPIPIRMDFQVGADPPVPLFGGVDLEVGMESTVPMGNLSPGTEVTWIGRFAYPSFADPFVSRSVASSHGSNAIVLTGGDNFFTIAKQKGMQPPYASPPGTPLAVPQALLPYVNSKTGAVTLQSNEMLEMFELGASPQDPSGFDFDDLMVKITTACQNGSEVLVRDSLNSFYTNENTAQWGSTAFTPSYDTWYQTLFEISPQETITLSKLKGVAAPFNPTFDVNGLDYRIRVWTDLNSALANPLNGNVADVFLSTPLSTPTATGGLSVDLQPWGPQPLYEFQFDITSFGVVIPAGQSRVISIQFESPTAGAAGEWGWVESSEPGVSDISFGGEVPWDYIVNIPDYHFFDGRLAIEVRGQSGP
jgi:hypothetical protein